MERKDYLAEELSKEEKKYLKILILNVRRKYIRDNYNYINNNDIDLYYCVNVETESVLDIVIKKCEKEIKSACEFEQLISNDKLKNSLKALSLKERIVLFCLYKKEMSVNETAKETRMDRTSVWRVKNRAIDKIMKNILGGEKDV